MKPLRACMLSKLQLCWLFATLWTVASQAALSMGFSRQEHWSGSPCPSPRDLPNPGNETMSLTSPILAAAAAKSLQSWPTLCDPIDGSPPGSAVPGILQARTLEWVAISFSKAVRFFITSAVWKAPETSSCETYENLEWYFPQIWGDLKMKEIGLNCGKKKMNSFKPAYSTSSFVIDNHC